MTKKKAKSCICTVEMLRRLAINIHGYMDVVDYDNCDEIIQLLKMTGGSDEEFTPENVKAGGEEGGCE